jgi:hypothetical protein
LPLVGSGSSSESLDPALSSCRSSDSRELIFFALIQVAISARSVGFREMTWLSRVRRQEERVRLPVGSVQVLGESPLWPTLAVLPAAGLYATLPGRFIVGSGAGAFGALRWIVPALTVVLIVPLALTVPTSGSCARPKRRPSV